MASSQQRAGGADGSVGGSSQNSMKAEDSDQQGEHRRSRSGANEGPDQSGPGTGSAKTNGGINGTMNLTESTSDVTNSSDVDSES